MSELHIIADICLNIPLYQQVEVDPIVLDKLRKRSLQFDAYCVACQKETTFRHISVYSGQVVPAPDVTDPGDFSLTIFCTRSRHSYVFYFRLLDNLRLLKIGQAPSIADIGGAEIRKYKNLLRGGYFEELNRATGLISHGVGIGSFVYLRRIFEKLIQDHRKQLERDSGPIDGFDGMRMAEKIGALSSVLPSSLVKNRAIYGILSSGIHELGEDDCKLYYPVVKAAIMQILEQDYEARKKREAEDEITLEISRIQEALAQRTKADAK
jgi:hypothetical protein